MGDFRDIADRIAEDIASGRLRPGQRLPPQRWFARRNRLAPSTAGRVYGELVRRGLVVGEVGRGTFVRATPVVPQGRALIEAATAAPVNLELNYPSAPGQSELLGPGLAPLLRPDVLAEADHGGGMRVVDEGHLHAIRPCHAGQSRCMRNDFYNATAVRPGCRCSPTCA